MSFNEGSYYYSILIVKTFFVWKSIMGQALFIYFYIIILFIMAGPEMMFAFFLMLELL